MPQLALPLGALLAQLTAGMLEPLPFSTCVLMSRELLAVPGVLVLLSLLQPELISLPAEQINASCVVGLLSLLPLVSSSLELLPATGVLASPPFVRGIVIDTPIALWSRSATRARDVSSLLLANRAAVDVRGRASQGTRVESWFFSTK